MSYEIFVQTFRLFSLSFEIIKLKFKRLSGHARAPTSATPKSAANDLFLAEEIELKPQSVQIVKPDILLKILDSHYSRVAGSFSWRQKFVDIDGGVVDADY